MTPGSANQRTTSHSPRTNNLERLDQELTAREMSAAIRNLRNNPKLLFVRLPSLLSFLCIVVGVVWLLLLPLNDYSRKTYISENALLPGQVHAYFSGSEQNVFRGYKQELDGLLNEGRERGGQKDDAEVTSTYVSANK